MFLHLTLQESRNTTLTRSTRVMDDLQSQILHVTSLTEEQEHVSHSIPAEWKRHYCCSTVTGALRLEHPPLASVCLNSHWPQSRQEFLRTRMDLELLPSAWTSPRVAFLALFFTDDGNYVTRLGREHNGQASQTQISWPISSFLTLRGSRLLLPPLVVAAMCHLYTSSPFYASCAWGYELCIPRSGTYRLETSRFLTRVGSNESSML